MSEVEESPASTGLPMSEVGQSPASTGHKWFNRKPRPTRSDSSNNWRSKSNNNPLGESCSGNNSVFSRDQDRTSRFKFRPSSSEIERWLDNQVTNPTTNLISYLSSPEGLHMVAQIVENRSLSPRIVIKLTKLVTQEGIRSSTEKHATNKIYGVFLGSAFLAQIQAYIGDILEPTAQDLSPFIHLFDEIQNRTADGWRFLPVETLREAINGIPEDAEKIELYQHFFNLVQFRNKFKMLQQLSKSDGCSQSIQCAGHRVVKSIGPNMLNIIFSFLDGHGQVSSAGDLPIIPTEVELSSPRLERLPINRICEKYNSMGVYLSTHFHLIREDCFASLRRAIQNFRQNLVPDNIRKYTEVNFIGTQCGDQGLEHCISFKTSKRKAVNWSLSKRMMFGSLLCISCDGFRNITWAIVKGRDPKSLENGRVVLQLIPSNEGKSAHLEKHKSYEMIESVAAYYEAYVHVLRCLQRSEMEELPFSEHLLSLEPQVGHPGYLKELQMKDVYDLKCAFPKIQDCLGNCKSTVHILQPWPRWDSSFDDSQMEAVKQGLTKRLAIIQGPPGTGKTYVGLTIARILLSNVNTGPILVICYTNHALDQFLESIYSVEENIVRLGGRCANENMSKRSLKELKQIVRMSGTVSSTHRELLSAKRDLKEQIQRNTFCLGARLISKWMLWDIASEQHIESLYSKYGINGENIEEVWLEAKDELAADKQVWKSRWKKEVLSTVPVTTFNRFSPLPEFEHDGNFHGFPGTADEVVVTKPAHQSSISLDEILVSQDLWLLPKKSRAILHKHWLDKARERAEDELHRLSQRYKEICAQLLEFDSMICLQILSKAKVVGMTTTAAARNYDLLQGLSAEIVVIEEAAEVLEAHVLPCIGYFTEHLILLGDHLQLRPSVAEYELATKHNLEISLFERLISAGIEHVTLRCQRRMRPEISRLISDIYPSLQDHFSVTQYENIKGIKNNVFFLDHRAMESQATDANSKVNTKEARLAVELCVYLLKQGYKNNDITILTMYKGQMSEIQRELNDRLRYRNYQNQKTDAATANPRVCSVDNYQGEECNIIILSLVRSNKMLGIGGSRGNIGFLKVSNRVCVALSRAKMGLYIFGNAELLSSQSTMWESIIQKLQSSESIGPAITLACQNHPQTETRVLECEDFRQVEDGGCSKPCEYQLKCGHACPRRCHPSDHEYIICPKPCPHKFETTCGHQCPKRCHFPADCPPCQVPVSKILPGCGHRIILHCSTAVENAFCNEPCPTKFGCGHSCQQKCGRPCGPCQEKVIKDLPCGHRARMTCSEDPCKFHCDQPCGKVLSPGCGHICRGTCESCKQGSSHILCKEQHSRNLACGHQCMAECSEICPPCKHPCEKRCLHGRCILICGALCATCTGKCEWKCEHHMCDLLCHEPCTRPRCDEPCQETLRCGHPCIGLCGEPCPEICRICNPDYLDVLSEKALHQYHPSDRFVRLIDCGHVFEVSGLDTWMDIDDAVAGLGATPVKLKQCPGCWSPIRRTLRYSNIIKRKLQQIEEVKRRVLGFEKVKRGNDWLKKRKYNEAMVEFTAVLSSTPWLLEAHLGQARVLCGQASNRITMLYNRAHYYDGSKEAIEHLCFIIEHSSYKELMLQKLPALSLKSSVNTDNVSSIAKNDLAIDALLQWALACSFRDDFATGLVICDIILQRNPNHAKTTEVRVGLENRVKLEGFEVTSMEVEGRGDWYQCHNGHFYIVGECGEPMQTSQCPHCKATVGGESHPPAAGNSHAETGLGALAL